MEVTSGRISSPSWAWNPRVASDRFSKALEAPPATDGRAPSLAVTVSMKASAVIPIFSISCGTAVPNASSITARICGTRSPIWLISSAEILPLAAIWVKARITPSSSALPLPTVARALPKADRAPSACLADRPTACRLILPWTASSSPRPGSLATWRNRSSCSSASREEPATAVRPWVSFSRSAAAPTKVEPNSYSLRPKVATPCVASDRLAIWAKAPSSPFSTDLADRAPR